MGRGLPDQPMARPHLSRAADDRGDCIPSVTSPAKSQRRSARRKEGDTAARFAWGGGGGHRTFVMTIGDLHVHARDVSVHGAFQQDAIGGEVVVAERCRRGALNESLLALRVRCGVGVRARRLRPRVTAKLLPMPHMMEPMARLMVRQRGGVCGGWGGDAQRCCRARSDPSLYRW